MDYIDYFEAKFAMITDKRQSVFNILLILFIIYGLLCKLLISINFPLNSDDVDAGMVSLEIWKHHNYLLDSYYFPSADPFWFSDILPFHLVPQIISDFNPMTIRIISYIIFLLIILVFSTLVYKISSNKTSALIFAALFANLYPESVRFFLVPTCHNGTIFFVGLFMVLFLGADYRLNLKSLIYILLVNLIVFSDSIFIAWFIIPFIFCYILLYKNKSLESNVFIAITTMSILFTYIYKSYLIKDFIPIAVNTRNLETILEVNLPLYADGLTTLLFGKAYEIKPFNYIYIIIFLILLYYIIVNNSYKNYVFIYFAISALVIFIGYVCTSLCMDSLTARYLTFTALSIYLLLALSYRKSIKIYVLLIFVILSLSASSNFVFVDKLDYQPNEGEFDLVNYLNSSDLKYGYSDYWGSNIINYLSKERISVLPIELIDSNKLTPIRWLSSEKWFADRMTQNSSEAYFILIKSDMFLKIEDINRFAKYTVPKNIQQFGNYTIYEFNGPAPIIDLNKKPIERSISLRAEDGRYLNSRSDHQVVAGSNGQTFTLLDLGNEIVALRAHDGLYVSAESGGGREIVANRNSMGPWEIFHLINPGNNSIALRAYNGQYVSVESDGKVVARSNSIGIKETFNL